MRMHHSKKKNYHENAQPQSSRHCYMNWTIHTCTDFKSILLEKLKGYYFYKLDSIKTIWSHNKLFDKESFPSKALVHFLYKQPESSVKFLVSGQWDGLN